MTDQSNLQSKANLDPITGEPGSHPIGVGVGATTGGIVAGAAAGTLAAGPVGTAVGAAVGAVVGGLGGKVVAEKIDPTVNVDYWRDNHATQTYLVDGATYDDYAPAYRLGSQPRALYANRSFDDVEHHLASDFEATKGSSSLTWDHAKHAVRAAWDRVSEGL